MARTNPSRGADTVISRTSLFVRRTLPPSAATAATASARLAPSAMRTLYSVIGPVAALSPAWAPGGAESSAVTRAAAVAAAPARSRGDRTFCLLCGELDVTQDKEGPPHTGAAPGSCPLPQTLIGRAVGPIGRGSVEPLPCSQESTPAAAARPSAIAHTINDCPRPA